MIIRKNIASSEHTQWVKSLQGRLRDRDGAWLRCNCLKEVHGCTEVGQCRSKCRGNDHSAQLRLGFGFLRRPTSYIPVVVSLHHHSRTLYPVQPRILG